MYYQKNKLMGFEKMSNTKLEQVISPSRPLTPHLNAVPWPRNAPGDEMMPDENDARFQQDVF